MSDPQGRTAGGTCLGGVLGGVLGVLIGGVIGSGTHSDFPKTGPVDPRLIDGCLGFFGMLIGAGIGGIIGAISGSVLGAGIATRSQHVEAVGLQERSSPQAPAAPPRGQAPNQPERHT